MLKQTNGLRVEDQEKETTSCMRWYGPALVAAYHVAIVVLKVAYTPGYAVIADGRVARRRRHHHFLDTGRRRRRRPRVVERQAAAEPRRAAAQPGRRRWR